MENTLAKASLANSASVCVWLFSMTSPLAAITRPTNAFTTWSSARKGNQTRYFISEITPLLHTGHYCVRMTKILILK